MASTSRSHHYTVDCRWTGNLGDGTRSYAGYTRDHLISCAGKPTLEGSSDPAFRGDRSRWNPEEMLVAAISSCHMLWYLHLCSEAGVVVTQYVDHARGELVVAADGGGQFASVTLAPDISISATSDIAVAIKLHERAHALCFIARSVNFPVACRPEVRHEN